jgi:DNA polymerase-3 subunit gamma/tau
MSYLALARKWRPQSFDKVVGQRPITQTLVNAIKSGRIYHAYLFTGPRGIGKTTVARILAKALNCQGGLTPSPCQDCPSCLDITRGSSLDVIEIDGASNRGIDEIRELREMVKYAPSRDRYKVYIIDEVHQLSKDAFNALLKTLEEPPPHVVFIFATTEAHKIPATILSRCQRFDFKRLASKEIEVHLQMIAEEEKIELEPTALLTLSHNAEGSLRDAQSLLDQMIAFCGQKITQKDVETVLGLVDQELLRSLLEALLAAEGKAVILLVAQATEKGYDLRQLTLDFLDYLRDLQLVKRGAPEMVERASSLVEILKEQSPRVSPELLNRTLEILLRAEMEMRRSPLPRLILETALLKLTLAKELVPLEEVLNKLSQLEGQAPTAPPATKPLSLFDPQPPQKPSNPSVPSPPAAPPLKAETPSAVESPAPPGETEDTPLTQEVTPSIHVCWQTIKEKIRRQRPALLGILEGAEEVRLEEQNNRLLIILREGNSFSKNMLEDRNNRDIIHRVFSECFGKDIPVEFIFGSSQASPQKTSAPPPPRKAESKDKGHYPPPVQETLEIFQGKVVPVSPAGGGKKKTTDKNKPEAE